MWITDERILTSNNNAMLTIAVIYLLLLRGGRNFCAYVLKRQRRKTPI